MAVMSSESKREYTARIHKVLEYVNKNIDGNLSLQKLAEVSCFSQFHFHRLFSSIVGETPLDFVKRLRLERAAGMLATRSSLSITDIAFTCGFSSSATFARAFKKHFEMSPTCWRVMAEQLMEKIQKSKKDKNGRKLRKANSRGIKYHDTVDIMIEKMKKIPMHITIKTFEPRHVAYVPNLEGYFPEKIRDAWEKLTSWAEPLALFVPTAEAIGISYDDPDVTPPDKCRYYACVTISPDIKPPKDIGMMDIIGGRYAVMAFNGTEEEIPTAYKRFFAEWLPKSGFEPADHPCFEIYYSIPENDPEGKFVMDICLPINPLS